MVRWNVLLEWFEATNQYTFCHSGSAKDCINGTRATIVSPWEKEIRISVGVQVYYMQIHKETGDRSSARRRDIVIEVTHDNGSKQSVNLTTFAFKSKIQLWAKR